MAWGKVSINTNRACMVAPGSNKELNYMGTEPYKIMPRAMVQGEASIDTKQVF